MSRPKRRPRPRLDATIIEQQGDQRVVHQEGWTEYIPAHELNIDDSYQRDINYTFVAEIAEDLDFGLLGTLNIARRDTGPYVCEGCGKELRHRDYVMDGQHRSLAVQQRGLLDVGLSCRVQRSQGVAWEADQYLRFNFWRKQPTSAGRYKAAVVAGKQHGWDNDADVQAMLAELGIETVSSTSPGGAMGHRSVLPAILAGIGAVCRFHEKYPDLIRCTLETLRDAWSENYGNAYDSMIMSGVMDFYAAHAAEAPSAKVTATLAAMNPEEVRDAADQMRGNRKYPLRVCVARVIAEAYNANKRSENRVREIAPAQYVNALRLRTLVATGQQERFQKAGAASLATISPEERQRRGFKAGETRRARRGAA